MHAEDMSWCSEWIRDWLRNGRSQAELAGLGDVDPANVSRWLSGQSKPDREAVGRLIASLGDSEAAELLVAWLRDILPEGAERLVRVAAVPKSGDRATTLRDDEAVYGGKAQVFPDGMSADLRERLLFFGELAVENTDVRKILDVCYQAARRRLDG